MAENGVKTTNLDPASTIDSVIGNKDGTTKRVSLADFARQVSGLGIEGTDEWLLAQKWAESLTPPDPDDQDSKSSKGWAGVAEGYADQTADDAEQTAADRVQTGNDRDAAIAAAEASGNIKFATTRVAAVALAASLADDKVIDVAADENFGGVRTRYVVTGGLIATNPSLYLPSVVQDNLGRSLLDPNLVGPARSGTRLRKALYQLTTGARKSLRTFTVADSLGTLSQATFNLAIEEWLKDWLPSQPYYGRFAGNSGGINGGMTTGSTSTRFEKTNYSLSWTGSYIEHTSGELSVWAIGNVTLVADKIMIPIIQQSGAGTLKVEIGEGSSVLGSVTYRNPTAPEVTSGQSLTGSELLVSADGTGMAFVVLEFADAQRRSIRLTEQGVGTVLTLDVLFEVENSASINSYRTAAGSNNFLSEQDAATGHMASLLGQFDPDVIFVESDDSVASYENFLPKLEAAIAASGIVDTPTVILVGNPGIGTNFGVSEAGLRDRIAYCHRYAAPRRWDVVDGLALLGGIDVLEANNLAPDKVHFTPVVWREMARHYVLDRGYAYTRFNTPGGNTASRLDIAQNLISRATVNRQITETTAMFAALMSTQIDTGWMTWSTTLAGTGSASKGASSLVVASGTAAGGEARIWPGTTDLDFGYLNNKGRVNVAKRGGMSTALRHDAASANGKAFMLLTDLGNGGGYVAGLTGAGFGWRIDNNILTGIAWDGVAEIATSDSVALVVGAAAENYKLDLVWGDAAINSLFKKVSFYVNNVLLGTLEYGNFQGRAFGVSITNGADASQNRIYVRPPAFITN